jgi:hypothetical protein
MVKGANVCLVNLGDDCSQGRNSMIIFGLKSILRFDNNLVFLNVRNQCKQFWHRKGFESLLLQYTENMGGMSNTFTIKMNQEFAYDVPGWERKMTMTR